MHRRKKSGYGTSYRRMLILRVTQNPTVTPGLMWPPLTCAITQTIVATLKPNASEMRTASPVSHDPHPTSTSSSVPTNSASSASQNRTDLTSSTLVVDISAICDPRTATADEQSFDDRFAAGCAGRPSVQRRSVERRN